MNIRQSRWSRRVEYDVVEVEYIPYNQVSHEVIGDIYPPGYCIDPQGP